MRGWRRIAGIASIVAVGWVGAASAEPEKIYVADEEANTVSVIDARLWTRSAVCRNDSSRSAVRLAF